MFQKNWQPKPLFALGQDVGQKMMGAGPAPTTAANGKPRGRGGTLTSLISEGGAVGGGIAGAAAGSVVPIVGTAIGGIIGAGVGALGGRLAENKIRDDEYHLAEAGKEGALSAALAGPLKALKYGGSAGKALKGGATLEKALISGAGDASKFTLRGAMGKGMDKAATNYAGKQFGLQPGFIGKFTKNHKEDPGKLIQRYGFSSIDDIESQIAQQNKTFGELVETAGDLDKNLVKRNLESTAMELINKGPSADKAMGAKLLSETEQLLSGYDDKIPAKVLNAIKTDYDKHVNYAMKQSDPATYGVNQRVANVLRETIQKATGSDQLKATGKELRKLGELADEAGARAPALSSRGASPINVRNLIGAGVGMSAGGAAGGIPGAIAGAGLTMAANSPKGRQTIFKGTNALAGALSKGADNAVKPMGMGLSAGIGQSVEGMINQPQPTQAQGLEGALLGGGDQSMSGNNMIDTAAPTSMSANTSNPFMGESYPNSQQMSSGSGITREAILRAMMMDLQETGGQNFDKIQMLYEFANPAQDEGLKLGNPAIARISDFESGISALDSLNGRIQESNVNNPLLGALRRMNPLDTQAQDLNSEIRTVRQLVGRALEGGVLRKEDEIKYEQMLPKIGDTDATARAKIENVRKLLTGNLGAYTQNQYNYSGGPSLESSLIPGGY